MPLLPGFFGSMNKPIINKMAEKKVMFLKMRFLFIVLNHLNVLIAPANMTCGGLQASSFSTVTFLDEGLIIAADGTKCSCRLQAVSQSGRITVVMGSQLAVSKETAIDIWFLLAVRCFFGSTFINIKYPVFI
ncbi:MAG: hypothetical protein KBC43_03420 [Bacteroidales bacterium]|nr:hypothetical protein [Bacteroidales bacterium]